MIPDIDSMFDKFGSIMGVSKEEYDKMMEMPYDSELTRLNETYLEKKKEALEKKKEAEEAEFCFKAAKFYFKAAVLVRAMKHQGRLE